MAFRRDLRGELMLKGSLRSGGRGRFARELTLFSLGWHYPEALAFHIRRTDRKNRITMLITHIQAHASPNPE